MRNSARSNQEMMSSEMGSTTILRSSNFAVRMSQLGHVWTAPAVQEESDVSAKRSGAVMYPAFECGRFDRWP